MCQPRTERQTSPPINRAFLEFASVIKPVALEQFFAAHWETRPFIYKGAPQATMIQCSRSAILKR
jgi:hypothetical protein